MSTPGAPRHPRQRGIFTICIVASSPPERATYPPPEGVVPKGPGEDQRRKPFATYLLPTTHYLSPSTFSPPTIISRSAVCAM